MMIDPCLHGKADPFPADFGDYICPIAAVFAGGERGATESVVSVWSLADFHATLSNLSALCILLLVTHRK
jgi:hypothetical protein